MYSMADENWRKQNKTISSRLKLILRKQIFTDVVFDVQGKEFKCHSLILAVGSPYFERTFYHTFSSGDSHLPITVSDITPEAFQCILTYLYTDELTFGNEKQAFETYEAAEKFKMDDLKSECEIFLSELDFLPRTVWNNLGRAVALKMERMEKKYIAYIENNAEKCLREETFLKTNEDILLKILKAEKLAVKELELLKRLASWGKRKDPYFPLKPFLCHIRFRALSATEFNGFIENNPIVINARDSIAILQHLREPHKNSLPTWCCRYPRRVWPV